MRPGEGIGGPNRTCHLQYQFATRRFMAIFRRMFPSREWGKTCFFGITRDQDYHVYIESHIFRKTELRCDRNIPPE